MSMGQGVLVIDDNPHLIELVRYNLERDDIYVKTRRSKYYDAKDLDLDNYKIIISELKLPGSSGIDLCKNVKRHNEASPAMFVLLINEEDSLDYEEALRCGVNDIFIKPVRIMALIDSIKTFLNMDTSKLSSSISTEVSLIENVTIDKNSYKVFINEEPVSFNFIEFNLFKLFLCNPGKLFTYGQLYMEMNTFGFILGLNSIQFQINLLMKKLNRFNFRFVNVSDVGFKLEIA